jgi:serine/threonine protein kinase
MQRVNLDQRLNRDTRIWHSLSHKNVVPVLGLCSDIGPSPAIISPLYDNGDVLRYLVSNPQANRLEIVSQSYFW